MTITELYSYTQTQANPYAFLSKYRLIGTKHINIFTNFDINALLEQAENFGMIKIESLNCSITIEDNEGEKTRENIQLDVEIFIDEFILSIDGDTIENYLMNKDYVEVSKY